MESDGVTNCLQKLLHVARPIGIFFAKLLQLLLQTRSLATHAFTLWLTTALLIQSRADRGLLYYAALLPKRGPHIASHSVCPSVPLSLPSVTSFRQPLASRMYFSARTEGRISYGHLGRTDSCYTVFSTFQFEILVNSTQLVNHLLLIQGASIVQANTLAFSFILFVCCQLHWMEWTDAERCTANVFAVACTVRCVI